MENKPLNYNLFSRLVFRGIEYLPPNIVISLGNIREWALKNRMIYEPEFQLIGKERLKELNKHFTSQDRLAILIQLYKDDQDNVCYLESPYVPARTLIRKAKEIEIVYWELSPTSWDANNVTQNYGRLYFGFWYSDTAGDEFISMSTAKLIVKKFYDLYQNLSSKYRTKTSSDGVLDIEVDGAIRAKFFKSSRLFDVELRQNPNKNLI